MKIVLAADGSSYTKKALAFLVTHSEIAGRDAQVVVVNVQPSMPPRVKSMVGATAVHEYHEQEAGKVLKPIEKFLARHDIPYTTRWCAGRPGDEIVKIARKEKATMVVMGTHGHGIIGRAILGSVAQNVLTQIEIPVLLVQ